MTDTGKRATVQELADDILAPEWRQSVKTLEGALAAVGWEHVDRPKCCGKEVRIESFIGSPYLAICDTCKTFVYDVTGPQFGNGHVTLIDSEKVDMDTDKTWVCGKPEGVPAWAMEPKS